MPDRGECPRVSGIAEVAERALECFLGRGALLNLAVRMITPLPRLVPLDRCQQIGRAIRDFIVRYEPKVAETGLYEHQADLLRKIDRGHQGVVLTSATASGKSLCFWAWILHRILKEPDPGATALLCFPTQALMWSQAERLGAISEPDSLVYHDQKQTTAYGGWVRIGAKSIPWSVWKGSGWGAVVDKRMKAHESTECFRTARILICTVDKAHFDLIRGTRSFAGKEFVRNLSGIVIDEAHVYQGIFGANVHFFLKRVRVACDLLGTLPPPVFLASATLPNAREFAERLTGVRADRVLSVEDKVAPQVDTLDVLDVPEALRRTAEDDITRILVFLRAGVDPVMSFLADESSIGERLNAIYFSPTKHDSRQLRMQLAREAPNRDHVVYDADLPPHERRALERKLNSGRALGTTVLATCALELGVDIEELDICVMDQPPPRLSALLQRVGRVGRRRGRPGLAFLSLSRSALYGRFLDDASAAFKYSSVPTLPLPLRLQMLKWRHMLAVVDEWPLYARREYGVSERFFDEIMRRHFQETHPWNVLNQRFEEKYGAVVNTAEPFWTHKGFRAISSDSKVPLVELERFDGCTLVEKRINGDRCDVAWIEDTQVYRDAHPEAIYLSHRGQRWRVRGYDHAFVNSRHRSTLPTMIFVERISKQIFTRGLWQERFSLDTLLTLPRGARSPRVGTLTYGIWNYEKRWDGYTEYALPRRFLRRVHVAEVSGRFWQAREVGERFPFLRPLRYPTFGWQWHWDGRISEIHAVSRILQRFLAGAVEAADSDLTVTIDDVNGSLSVIDGTRGGNGLSESLLWADRFAMAISRAIRIVESEVEPDADVDSDDIGAPARSDEVSRGAIVITLRELQRRWGG